MQQELDILNRMMATMGEKPTTTVDSKHPSVIMARNVLTSVNRVEQGTGWYFNTEYNRTLAPNSSGEIVIPENTLRVDSTNPSDRFVPRPASRVLYNIDTGSTLFTSPVTVQRVFLVPYGDLPPVAFDYIRAAATYAYFLEADGETTKHQGLLADRTMAYRKLRKEHINWVGSNVLHSSAVLQMMPYGYPHPYRQR